MGLQQLGSTLVSMTSVITEDRVGDQGLVRQPASMFVSEGHAVAGAILMWRNCAVTWDHGDN